MYESRSPYHQLMMRASSGVLSLIHQYASLKSSSFTMRPSWVCPCRMIDGFDSICAMRVEWPQKPRTLPVSR